MRLLRRRDEARRLRIITELEALKDEFPDASSRSFIDDVRLYAEIGRDRYSLDDEWVTTTRRHLESSIWTSGSRARKRWGLSMPEPVSLLRHTYRRPSWTS